MTNHTRTQTGASPDEEHTSPTQKTRLKDRLDVSDDVLETALGLYDQVEEVDMRGHDSALVPIAVIYIAIRQHGVARSITEVADAADVSTSDLYRTATAVGDVLDQHIPPMEPERYVGRIADDVGVSEETIEPALRALSRAKAAGYHSGRKPEGLAAAAIYTAIVETETDLDVTQHDLARTTSVSTETIRRSYHQMRELRED